MVKLTRQCQKRTAFVNQHAAINVKFQSQSSMNLSEITIKHKIFVSYSFFSCQRQQWFACFGNISVISVYIIETSNHSEPYIPLP